MREGTSEKRSQKKREPLEREEEAADSKTWHLIKIKR